MNRPRITLQLTLVFPLLALSLLLAQEKTFVDFEDFLNQYRAATDDMRVDLVTKFIEWQKNRGGFPIIERDGTVIFFYLGSGSEKGLSITGDFRPQSFYNVYWDEAGALMTQAAANAPVFYKRFQFERDARLDYRFVVDGHQRIDPLNPRVFDGGISGDISELVMPEYKTAAEADLQENVPQGKLSILEEAWAKPKVSVYLPPRYAASQKYHVIYTADGSAWIQYIKLPVILDNLIARGNIAPVIAVLIDPAEDRFRWYYFNEEYLAYLEKVIAYIDTHYSTVASAEGRLHMGTSAGGRITMFTALERPDLFKKIAMLSPSLQGPPHYYERYFSGRKKPPSDLKIWLSAGTYEKYIYYDTQTMARYFKSVGLKTKVVFTHEGHSFGTWRNVTPEVLRHFFAETRGSAILAPELHQ